MHTTFDFYNTEMWNCFYERIAFFCMTIRALRLLEEVSGGWALLKKNPEKTTEDAPPKTTTSECECTAWELLRFGLFLPPFSLSRIKTIFSFFLLGEAQHQGRNWAKRGAQSDWMSVKSRAPQPHLLYMPCKANFFRLQDFVAEIFSSKKGDFSNPIFLRYKLHTYALHAYTCVHIIHVPS